MSAEHPVTVEEITLDGVPTLRLRLGDYLLGYLQAGGWVGSRRPSEAELAEIELPEGWTP